MIEDKEQILSAFSADERSEALSLFLDDMDRVIIEALAKSFTQEKHKLTGKLIDDIKTDVEINTGGFIISYLAYKYGAYLNFGVRAERIPYTRGSGASSSLYITGLMKYVRLRMGISDARLQKSVAFAIANKHKQKGMPLRTLGMGTKWIDKTGDKTKAKIAPLFDQLAETYIVKTIRDVITEKERL